MGHHRSTAKDARACLKPPSGTPPPEALPAISVVVPCRSTRRVNRIAPTIQMPVLSPRGLRRHVQPRPSQTFYGLPSVRLSREFLDVLRTFQALRARTATRSRPPPCAWIAPPAGPFGRPTPPRLSPPRSTPPPRHTQAIVAALPRAAGNHGRWRPGRVPRHGLLAEERVEAVVASDVEVVLKLLNVEFVVASLHLNAAGRRVPDGLPSRHGFVRTGPATSP
jgi:hypothetical protein